MKKLLIGLLMILIITSLLVSCQTTTTQSTTSTASTTASTAVSTTITTQSNNPSSTVPATTVTSAQSQTNWWDTFGTPQHGGELNLYSRNTIKSTFDPNLSFNSNDVLFEKLLFYSWTQDREEYPNTSGLIPEKYQQGWLAESWQWNDPQTLVIKIRNNVYWQKTSLVDGRELVADDIVHHYQRLGGLGGGYTKGSPFFSSVDFARWDNIKAIDDHTIVFTFKQPSIILNYFSILSTNSPVTPPEMAKTEGGFNDWKTASGTGPFIFSDLIPESSESLVRNPDYWGYDERYPENKLPYVDKYNIIYIPDVTTALAAVRTGKIDFIDGLDTVQGDTLQKTSPDIVLGTVSQNGWAIEFRCDIKPFDDIKVRKALQMAVNFDELVKNYYQGKVPSDPCSFCNPINMKGYCLPYSEWPADLQAEYKYNVTEAKQLMTDAGYPNGFSTNILTSSAGGPVYDLQILQIVKSYYAEIGVQMEIKTMEYSAFKAYISAMKHDGMTQSFYCGVSYLPSSAIDLCYSKSARNLLKNNDAYYDSLVAQFNNVMTEEEAMAIVQKCDLYAAQQHWRVSLPLRVRINAFQPYIKGYWANEYLLEHFQAARVWIDTGMKQTLGY